MLGFDTWFVELYSPPSETLTCMYSMKVKFEPVIALNIRGQKMTSSIWPCFTDQKSFPEKVHRPR